MKRACTSKCPQLISERTVCFATLVMISRQFKVISESSKSTNNEVMMSTSLKHLTRWCSFDLMKVRFRIMRTIILRCSINSSSVTSWCRTVTSRFLFFRSSSKAFCSCCFMYIGFLPLDRGAVADTATSSLV